MCKVLNINESGYYKKIRNKQKVSKKAILSVEIQAILKEDEENANYGVNRMLTALKQRNISVSKRTVYRAMSEMGLIHTRRVPHGITKATTEIQERENLIKRDFTAQKPMEKCLCDITEIQTSEGKLYISAILDCFDGAIIGLQIRDNMRKELCIDTVKTAFNKNGNGVILHSDRGSQYTSAEYKNILAKMNIVQSLSGAGHCFDNARMESFFATLKKELLYQIPTYKMKKGNVKSRIYRYIFGYYNTRRINSFNPDGLPPTVYKNLYYSKNKEKSVA